MADFQFPTEVVDLPSQGKLYPKESPLAKGTIEIRYPTAKDEDILTSVNLVRKGQVIDKFIQNLIVDKKIKYSELLIGDKNAIMIAARILAYGKKYEVEFEHPTNGQKVSDTIDLTSFKDKIIDESLLPKSGSDIPFKLPNSKIDVTFKLLTALDEDEVTRELEGLKKISKVDGVDRGVTTRLKRLITSVNGDSDKATITEFVDNYLLSRDAVALREHARMVTPDIDLSWDYMDEDGVNHTLQLPITTKFFWPESAI
tara:strand:- start:532 stop:1302 length:771 start_codon:yes stop_codon:yes gene_type:complete